MQARGYKKSWWLYGINLDDDWYSQAVARTILGALVPIFSQNLRFTRKWSAIQDRRLHHHVSRRILLKDETLLRTPYVLRKWAKMILLQ